MGSDKNINNNLKKKRNIKNNKYCPKCGKENTSNAEYCAECGAKLDITGNKIKNEKETWWEARSSNEKVLTGISACCIGIFLIILIAGLMAPELTSLEVVNATINENITEYTIKGIAEANATVNITCSQLNITNAKAQVDKEGNFVYKIKIPRELTELTVTINAVAPEKTENSAEIIIQRPTTKLSLKDIPTITENNKTVTISGTTDPYANVTISSSDLNSTDIQIKADSEGKFTYEIEIPENIGTAEINVKAKVLGKKQKSSSLIIVRKISPTETTTQSTNSESTSSSENSESESSSSESRSYVGSVNSDKFHYLYCSYVKRIHTENKIYFSSRQEALNAGYVPCKRCNP